MAIEVRKRYPVSGPPPSHEELKEMLTRHTFGKAVTTSIAAYYVAADLARHYVPGTNEPTPAVVLVDTEQAAPKDDG
jgi:hypothetical protein